MSIPELSSPISSSGVEVDPQNHGLYLHYHGNNLPEAYNENETNKVYRSPGQAQAETILQNRWVILRLRVILALGWILAIIAIAIAGTLAAKRLHELHHLPSATCEGEQGIASSPSQNLKSIISTFDTTATYTTAISGSFTASPSVPSNSVAILNTTCPPSTNCSALSSPYTAFTDAQFNIQCETDYYSPVTLLLAVYVFQFEDCINACASYNEGINHANSTCFSASYSIGVSRATQFGGQDGGNCWLTGTDGGQGINSVNRSSAVLMRS